MWDSKIKPSRSLKRSRYVPTQFNRNRMVVAGLQSLEQNVQSARSAVLKRNGNQQYDGLVGSRSSPYATLRNRPGTPYFPKFKERFRPRQHRRHRRNYGEKRPMGRIYPVTRLSGVPILPASSYAPPHQMYNTIMGSGIVDINSDGRDLFAYRNEPNPMGGMLNQFVTRPMMQHLPYHNYFFARYGRLRNKEEWKQDRQDYRIALQVLNHPPAAAVTSYPTLSMGRNVSTQFAEVFSKGGVMDVPEDDVGDFQAEQNQAVAQMTGRADGTTNVGVQSGAPPGVGESSPGEPPLPTPPGYNPPPTYTDFLGARPTELGGPEDEDEFFDAEEPPTRRFASPVRRIPAIKRPRDDDDDYLTLGPSPSRLRTGEYRSPPPMYSPPRRDTFDVRVPPEWLTPRRRPDEGPPELLTPRRLFIEGGGGNVIGTPVPPPRGTPSRMTGGGGGLFTLPPEPINNTINNMVNMLFGTPFT
jgi:hypothetical protein